MDSERIINGKIFDVWKKDYPLLFNETNPNLSLKNAANHSTAGDSADDPGFSVLSAISACTALGWIFSPCHSSFHRHDIVARSNLKGEVRRTPFVKILVPVDLPAPPSVAHPV